jgi:hypothetical protein
VLPTEDALRLEEVVRPAAKPEVVGGRDLPTGEGDRIDVIELKLPVALAWMAVGPHERATPAIALPHLTANRS